MLTQIENIKNKELKIEVKSNKNNLFYIHFLNKGNTLLISAYYKNEISKFEYESEFDLSYIKKVKLFTLYDTLDECLDEIFSGINTGKSSIIEDNNFINLNIPLNNIKFKEIIFKIEQKKKSDKDKIDELYEIIKELKQENIYLKNKIEELLNFKKEIEDEKKRINNSNIINDNNDYKKYLKNWISPNQIVKTELLMRLSRDGDSVQTFHNLCDNISPTLVLVESLNGNIFGGYTTCQWDRSGQDKRDGKTFLFSLTKNKIFIKKNNKDRDISCGKDNGPIFGGNDFYFYPTLKKYYSHSSYYFLDNKDLADNEKDDFEVKEVEIYKCLFE